MSSQNIGIWKEESLDSEFQTSDLSLEVKASKVKRKFTRTRILKSKFVPVPSSRRNRAVFLSKNSKMPAALVSLVSALALRKGSGKESN